MKKKYTVPKLYKTRISWYAYFLYKGKEFRYRLDLNEIEDLKERERKFLVLCEIYHDKLKEGWNPNNAGEEDNLFLGRVPEDKVIKFIMDLGKDNQNLKINLKHINIFCNNGFVLFEHILNEYIKQINTKGRQSDLLFYYWKMYDNKPQYIHQRPTEFFSWFDKEYKETTGQLRTLLQVETPQRNKDFSNALDWFKLQNQ